MTPGPSTRTATADAPAAGARSVGARSVGTRSAGTRAGSRAVTTEIGVVIGVPEPHASVLSWWRRQIGDPMAGLVWPHVTLVPPTVVARDSLAVVVDHLTHAAAGASPFVMHLSGTGSFRPVSPVVFVQVAAGLGSCELLERAVRGGPIVRDLEFPYHPHVTVAHGVGESDLDRAYDALAGFAARFPVSSFQLFERSADGVWRQLREFELGTGAAVVHVPDDARAHPAPAGG